jgi:hypothetical protein
MWSGNQKRTEEDRVRTPSFRHASKGITRAFSFTANVIHVLRDTIENMQVCSPLDMGSVE